MNHEFFYPYDNSKLWTKSLILLSITYFLIYASTYMLLPATSLWMMQQAVYDYSEICLSLGAFGIGIFLPGLFNSYIIDRFKRKTICTLSLVCMTLIGYLYLLIDTPEQWMGLRMIHGAFFGISTMTIGSTMAIDVTISHRRTSANLALNRISLLAITSGLIAGVGIMSLGNFEKIIWIFIISMAISILLLLFVRITFRAPLQSSLFSLDRFLLPRAFYPAIIVMMLSVIIGIMILKIFTVYFYISLLVGISLAFFVTRYTRVRWSEKNRIEIGIMTIVSSLIVLFITQTLAGSCIAALLLGMGISICATTLYTMMIQVAVHCERGTSNNTYQLFWELGIIVSVLLEYLFNNQTKILYLISLSLAALVLLIYELSLHKWYKQQVENK